MCARNCHNIDRSPRATPVGPPLPLSSTPSVTIFPHCDTTLYNTYLVTVASLSIPIVTLPFIIEQAWGGGVGGSTREESQWGKIVTLRSLDMYYKGGSNRGRGGSPGDSTRRTVNVMVISSTHSDNELLEPVNFRFEDRS